MDYYLLIDIVGAIIIFVIICSERRQKRAAEPESRLLHLLTSGSQYLWNLSPYLVYAAMSLWLTLYGYITSRDVDQKRRCLLMLVYMLLAICGIALEICVYGITWVWPFMALSLMLIYKHPAAAYIWWDGAWGKEKAAQLKKELIDTRIRVMLSH